MTLLNRRMMTLLQRRVTMTLLRRHWQGSVRRLSTNLKDRERASKQWLREQVKQRRRCIPSHYGLRMK